jgi:hypothetical protein
MKRVEAKSGPGATQMTANQVLEELVEVVRDLHELLGSYAPMWYTEEIDHRVSTILKNVSSASGSQQEYLQETSTRH